MLVPDKRINYSIENKFKFDHIHVLFICVVQIKCDCIVDFCFCHTLHKMFWCFIMRSLIQIYVFLFIFLNKIISVMIRGVEN